jgi:hypothetical protein
MHTATGVLSYGCHTGLFLVVLILVGGKKEAFYLILSFADLALHHTEVLRCCVAPCYLFCWILDISGLCIINAPAAGQPAVNTIYRSI